jgi:hypothetical protein
LVPAIITEPIMSSATFASWADSGIVTRDTLDTCVVEIPDSGIMRTYSIDMLRGVVIGFIVSGGPDFAQHQYFYGYDKGIYYPRRVTFGYDTTIEYGGYEFDNIRVNGEPVPVITPAKRNPERFSVQWLDGKHGTISLAGITGPARATLFDIQGRRITPGDREVNGKFEIGSLCPSRGCPSGPVLVRIEHRGIARIFQALLVR